jgi:hypothetical protein
MPSNNLQIYCYIDNKTNKCTDDNYTIVYDNKGTDVYKVNYYGSPSSISLNPGPNKSQPTNIGSTRFNNNTQLYAHLGHDVGDNTTYTGKYRS